MAKYGARMKCANGFVDTIKGAIGMETDASRAANDQALIDRAANAPLLNIASAQENALQSKRMMDAGAANTNTISYGSEAQKRTRGYKTGTAFLHAPKGVPRKGDHIPVTLEHGEAVLPKKTVRAIGVKNIAATIKATNDGKSPKIGVSPGGKYARGTSGEDIGLGESFRIQPRTPFDVTKYNDQTHLGSDQGAQTSGHGDFSVDAPVFPRQITPNPPVAANTPSILASVSKPQLGVRPPVQGRAPTENYIRNEQTGKTTYFDSAKPQPQSVVSQPIGSTVSLAGNRESSGYQPTTIAGALIKHGETKRQSVLQQKDNENALAAYDMQGRAVERKRAGALAERAQTVSEANQRSNEIRAAREKYTPLMGKDESGNTVYQGAFDTGTGQRIGVPAAQVAQVSPGTPKKLW